MCACVCNCGCVSWVVGTHSACVAVHSFSHCVYVCILCVRARLYALGVRASWRAGGRARVEKKTRDGYNIPEVGYRIEVFRTRHVLVPARGGYADALAGCAAVTLIRIGGGIAVVAWRVQFGRAWPLAVGFHCMHKKQREREMFGLQ